MPTTLLPIANPELAKAGVGINSKNNVMSAGTFGGGEKVEYRRERLPSTIVVVVEEEVDVVGDDVVGAIDVVVDVVGVLPLGPDGDLVSQPATSAHSRSPGPSTLRIAFALSDCSTCCSIGPRMLEELLRKSNRYPRPA